MLNLVEARTSQGALFSLPLSDVSGGFSVVDINGLGPVKATLVSTSFAQMNGEQYISSRRGTRNIVLTVKLLPDYILKSVRQLRNQLYSFFMPERGVDLRFYDSDGLTVNIAGVVESCEPSLFSKEPAVDISIICFDPDFIDLTPSTLNGMTTEGSAKTLISYNGSLDAGIQFILNVNRALSTFTIYHTPPDGVDRSLIFNSPAGLVAGDVVTINTVPGAKSLTLTRSGGNSSLLYAMTPQSNWIALMPGDNYTPGDNYIRVSAAGIGIPFTITYSNRYGGL